MNSAKCSSFFVVIQKVYVVQQNLVIYVTNFILLTTQNYSVNIFNVDNNELTSNGN